MVIHSRAELCAVRQEQVRYDSGCYFRTWAETCIADSFLLSHGLERSMRMCQCPPAAVRAKFQGEFLDSSVDIGVDRLALFRSWVPGLIALNGVTSQPVFSDAAQEIVVPQSCLSRASVAGDSAAADHSTALARAAASAATHV